jgi:hypothetical protein
MPVMLMAAPQLPPPNLVENGDARAGESHWTRSRSHKPLTGEAQDASLMIGQAAGRGTPQNGSAARVKDVEVRLFETREDAAAYLRLYEAQYNLPATVARQRRTR